MESATPAASAVFVTIGSTGDLHPFLRLAIAMRDMGREVLFVTNPYHEDLVRRCGLNFVGAGSRAEFEHLLEDPRIWDPRQGFAALLADYGRWMREVVDTIATLPRSGPRIAIAHPMTLPALAVARERGTVDTIAGGWLAPSNLKTCHDPLLLGPLPIPRWVPMSWRRALWRRVERRFVDPVPVPQINAMRADFGLAPIASSYLDHMVAVCDLSLTLFPEWFAPTQPDWPQPLLRGDFMRFDAAADQAFSPELDRFLDQGEAPIVFAPGSANFHAGRWFTAAIAAVQGLGRRAILLSRHRAQLPATLPAGVLWQAYVPFTNLLPRCAAIVHHGGIGTTAEALRAGVPQVVTPFGWDQFDNAARVVALGVARSLPAARVSGRSLAERLAGLLGDTSVAAAVAASAASCGDHSAADRLVRELEAGRLESMSRARSDARAGD